MALTVGSAIDKLNELKNSGLRGLGLGGSGAVPPVPGAAAPIPASTPGSLVTPSGVTQADALNPMQTAQQRAGLNGSSAARAATRSFPFEPAPFDPGAGRGPGPTAFNNGAKIGPTFGAAAAEEGAALTAAKTGLRAIPALGVAATVLPPSIAAGGYAVDKIFGDKIDQAYGHSPNEPTAENKANIAGIAAANPDGQLARFLRGDKPAPAALPGNPAESGTIGAPVVPAAVVPQGRTTEGFAPGSVQARGLQADVNNPAVIPRPGEGFITSSNGSAARFNNAVAPQGLRQPAVPTDPREAANAVLQQQLQSNTGDEVVDRKVRARAAQQLLTSENTRYATDTTAATARAANGLANTKYLTEQNDKRVTDFNKQFVENQFYTANVDPKSGKSTTVPDAVRNASFLDFARQASPYYQTPEGQVKLTNLPAEERNKVISDLRGQFLEKENVEQKTNDSAWFTKPGLSNAPLQVTGRREAVAGDIPQIGLGNYLYSNLPGTNNQVVDTDRGALLEEDYVGDSDSEGSRDRRIKANGLR